MISNLQKLLQDHCLKVDTQWNIDILIKSDISQGCFFYVGRTVTFLNLKSFDGHIGPYVT